MLFWWNPQLAEHVSQWMASLKARYQTFPTDQLLPSPVRVQGTLIGLRIYLCRPVCSLCAELSSNLTCNH